MRATSRASTACAPTPTCATATGNSIYPVLIAPDGTEYLSGTTLLFALSFDRFQSVTSPAPGTWTLEIRGIQSGTGENVASILELVEGTFIIETIVDTEGLDDIDGHPADGAIVSSVHHRLADGVGGGVYRPDQALQRGELAEYLVMGDGIRQFLPLAGPSFGDVDAALAPFVEAVTARGAALRDMQQRLDGVMQAGDGGFHPEDRVSRAALAYSLVQSLGLQEEARGFSGDVSVGYRDEVIVAEFRPNDDVTRGAFAVSAVAALHYHLNGVTLGGGADARVFAGGDAAQPFDARPVVDMEQPSQIALGQNYPNPFNPATQIGFALPEAGPVRLAVYDLLGRRVRVLVDSAELSAGAHTVTFEASDLASGTYLYRLETPNQMLTRRMTLMK